MNRLPCDHFWKNIFRSDFDFSLNVFTNRMFFIQIYRKLIQIILSNDRTHFSNQKISALLQQRFRNVIIHADIANCLISCAYFQINWKFILNAAFLCLLCPDGRKRFVLFFDRPKRCGS